MESQEAWCVKIICYPVLFSKTLLEYHKDKDRSIAKPPRAHLIELDPKIAGQLIFECSYLFPLILPRTYQLSPRKAIFTLGGREQLMEELHLCSGQGLCM